MVDCLSLDDLISLFFNSSHIPPKVVPCPHPEVTILCVSLFSNLSIPLIVLTAAELVSQSTCTDSNSSSEFMNPWFLR